MRTSYTEKDPFVGHFEGNRASSSDGGMGGGTMLGVLMAVAFVFIVLFLIMRRDREDTGGANNLMSLYPLMNMLNNSGLGNNLTRDDPVHVAEKEISTRINDSNGEQRTEQEMTRALIVNKFDRLEDREYQKILAENNALKSEASNSRQSRYLETKIDRVDDLLMSGRSRPRSMYVEEGVYI